MTQADTQLTLDEARRVIDMLLAAQVPPGAEFRWLMPDEVDTTSDTQARPALNEPNIDTMEALMRQDGGWNWQGMKDWMIVFHDARRVGTNQMPNILAHGFHRQASAKRVQTPMYVLWVPGTVEMAQFFAAAANRESDLQTKRDDATRDNAIRMALFNPLCRGLSWRAIANHVGGKVDHKTVKKHYDRYVAAGTLEPWDTEVVRTADGREMRTGGIGSANAARATEEAPVPAPVATENRIRICDQGPMSRANIHARLQGEGWFLDRGAGTLEAIVVRHRDLGETSLVFVDEAEALIASSRERRVGAKATATGQMITLKVGEQQIERKSLGGLGPLVTHEATASSFGAYTLTCLPMQKALAHSDDLERLHRLMGDLSTPQADWMVEQASALSQATRAHYQQVMATYLADGKVWTGRKAAEEPAVPAQAAQAAPTAPTTAMPAQAAPGAVEEAPAAPGAIEDDALLTPQQITAAALGLQGVQALLLTGYQIHAQALQEVDEDAQLSGETARRVLEMLNQALRELETATASTSAARQAA